MVRTWIGGNGDNHVTLTLNMMRDNDRGFSVIPSSNVSTSTSRYWLATPDDPNPDQSTSVSGIILSVKVWDSWVLIHSVDGYRRSLWELNTHRRVYKPGVCVTAEFISCFPREQRIRTRTLYRISPSEKWAGYPGTERRFALDPRPASFFLNLKIFYFAHGVWSLFESAHFSPINSSAWSICGLY